MTVCATNVRKRHTWQFKQLDASTRDDHGHSARRQRTNLHTLGPIPDQQRLLGSSRNVHFVNATVRACITEISICSFWLALSLLGDVGYATMNENSHGSSSIVT